MLNKKTIIILLTIIFYQSPLLSQSNSFKDFKSTNLSKYFSGIVAYENKDNTNALNYFNSAKILINKHDPYLERLVMSLVLEDKITQAINLLKINSKKSNSDFFEAYILLALENLKKNNIDKALEILTEIPDHLKKSRFDFITFYSLKQYAFVFKNKMIPQEKENFGQLSLITETFQRCYLSDKKTNSFFSNLINSNQGDYSRYIFFNQLYLIENDNINEAKSLTKNLDYINNTLLLSQGKYWVESNQINKFKSVFSCKNHQDIVGEFLFLISNLYSSQDKFEESNFYLRLSNYLNPKFIFNLSLLAENFYLNENYEQSKTVLKNFDKNYKLYYWYRIKKESQIISKTKNKKEGLNYMVSKFNEIENPSNKMIFDLANFYKNSREFNKAIQYYTQVINSLDEDNEIKSDLLYRRGGSYERLKDFSNADKDLLYSLKINPEDAYVLNYLAYSWLERDYKIDEAIKMLEKAYAKKSDDPYIIDSIGWAYFLINDFIKAEKFLKRAVELMPLDPIVNDHYGDILWSLDRKLQARYFWNMVLKMEEVEEDLIIKIENKLIEGPKNS